MTTPARLIESAASAVLPRAVAAAVIVAGMLASAGLHAQIDAAPISGIRDATPRVHALTGARVHITPDRVLENATVVLRDGRIEAVGENAAVPADARVWDVAGKTIYAGFIDPMSKLGLPPGLAPPPRRRPGQPPAPAPAAPESATGFWNPVIRPETDVAALLELDADAVEAMRALGFTAVHSVPRRGVLRGQSAVVLTSDPANARKAVLAARVAQHVAAELNSDDTAEYPTALMGAVALMRQALYDAQWYRDIRTYEQDHPQTERAAENSALAALEPVLARTQQVVYATDDELDYGRARTFASEFDLDLVIYGNGHEYRRAVELAGLAHAVILPLDFPPPPDIDAPDDALEVSLEALQHWELAPSNAAFLAQAGVPFAFTTDRLENPGREFWRNVRTTVERGVSLEQALAALTTMPAEILGLGDVLGTLERGKLGNLVVADADLFADDEARIELVFVDGIPYELDPLGIEPEGRWSVTSPRGGGEWLLGAVDTRSRVTLTIDGTDYRGRIEGEALLLFPAASVFGAGAGLARLSGFIDAGRIEGLAELPDGSTFAWTARYLGPLAEDGDAADGEDEDEEPAPALDPRPYPAGAFGVSGPPALPASLLVRGATVWTSTPRGRLENADLLVRDGRIAAIGPGLTAPRGALVIDGQGKHVTAGLIDAHSHTAISRGVNELGSAVTVEVRVADVLDPTDINIYRQLAGGVTVANVMHGSANPMGGQTQTIKLRWGGDAAGLVFDGAPPGVKFALGENVKQSNWGDQFTTRYPQTRMGVDQIIRDTFAAASRYGVERAARRRGDPPVRRNLRLDAALEILSGARAVHIHSYRQDEILAFVRIAQERNLRVAAFQHVLEGYKVGPEIASIGAGGSTFSDWWGYKYEVIDAIPYNGALMRSAGVVVSFNSDDDELATRLNTEAAKAIKYGGLSEEEALDFVTINPAIQLGVDARVGSLEPGKDADFVIWSGDPLSVFSRAEQTWIDGRRYFDLDDDAKLRETVRAERARLIQKALAARARATRPGAGDGAADERSAGPSDLYRRSARVSQEQEGTASD